MDSVAELHAYFRDFDAQHSKCPVAQRQRELREEREAERERVRKGRETRHQRDAQLQSAESWRNWAIGIADERIDAAMSLGGAICSVVGEVIGRKSADVRKHMLAEVATLRRELAALEERLKAVPGKLPVAKVWQPESVTYQAEFVSHNGALFQARKDTAQAPGGSDWICVARAGKDGRDAPMPNFRGMFDVDKKYRKFDVIEYAGGAFVAIRDNPAIIPGEDGWQCLALPGGRGPEGAVGPRGQKGERGARGEAAPTIINWTLDRAHYRAVPTMSNGTQGAVLELRDLFEQFLNEAVLGAVDEAMRDAAKTKLLSPLY